VLPAAAEKLRRAGHGTLAAVVEALQRHNGAASVDQIARHVWAHDPDGGPLQPHSNVYQAKRRGADALAALGLQIKTRRGPGAVWVLEAAGAKDEQ
jgi:hypothetical protein